MLADRGSREFFDPVTLWTLRCIRLVKGFQLTLEGKCFQKQFDVRSPRDSIIARAMPVAIENALP